MRGDLRTIVVVLALALVLPAAWSAAQTTTAGSIRGTITDSNGDPLPGVNVVATSDALVAGRTTAVTSAAGVYRFPSLPPGTYTIEAQLPGFQTVRQESVRVSLGQILGIDLQLPLASVTDEIVVIAQSAQVSTVSNVVGTNLDQQFIQHQPVPRSTTDLINYAPGVNNGDAYGAPNDQANAYNLDGVDVSDPASGSQWILPNVDWIQEVQVMGLGADAEFGGFTGAVVNLITKSGGNEVHGNAAVYYSGGSLNSENAPAGAEGVNKLSRDLEISVGLGGPVIRDKLWYFVSGEERSRKIDPFFIEGASADDRGQYERSYHRYLAKLTLQANQANRFAFMLDYDGLTTDNRNIGEFVLASGAYNQDSPNWAYNFTWESLVNANNFFAVKLTGFNGKNDYLPKSGSDVPGHDDYFNSGFLWGNYTYTWLTEKKRLNLDASWSLFADDLLVKDDSHTFKFGVVYEDSGQDEVRTRNGGFTYVDDSYYCDSLDDYFADPFCGVSSSDRGNEINFHATQKGLHLYAQDSWKLERVTVNAGLRYTSYQGGFKNGNDSVYDVNMVAPRIGAVWDVFGDASTAVKVHYGRYYDALMAFMYDREASGSVWSPYEFWDYNFDTGEFDIFAGSRQTGGATMDPGISHPYVDQWVGTVERQLTDTTLIGLDYIYRKNHDIIAMVNTNDDYDSLIAPGDPLTGGDLPFFELLSYPDFVITNPSAAFREYKSAVLRLHRRYQDGWSLQASLVWSDLTGNTVDVDGYEVAWTDKNGQVNNTGKLPGSSEWVFKVNASVDLPWDMIGSAFYLYRTGAYWTPYATLRGLYRNDRTDINLVPLGSEQYDDRSLLDLHLEKTFKLPKEVDLTLLVDVFNVFNSDTVLSVQERWGTYYYDYQDHPGNSEWVPSSGYKQPTSVESPREIRLGARVSF